ncbi:MAG: hypothetical protein IJE28_00040 [Oscillospiraceae bacterium]|nr:hypothetical protein [Oscillospiraceae bacterium]MBQ3500987.1 hypothetical protein [Oscillospiraceae bacterium]MBQ4643460.1 hypothetical protein [Oscillospiraceae bacterium]
MLFKKLLLIICALVFVCAGCAGSSDETESAAEPGPEPEIPSSSEEEIEYTEDYYDRLFFGDVISDETVRENIFAALIDVGINTEFIKEFQKIEDGSETEKFGFIYRENAFTVTMEPDSTVYSVKIGDDGEEVYLKGYESYNADDYMMTENMKNWFIAGMDNAVEIALDYPEIYEFAGDWSFRHEGNFYYVTVTVLTGAEKEKHFLSITYYYDEPENTMYWYQLLIDGQEISVPIEFEVHEKGERKKLSGE